MKQIIFFIAACLLAINSKAQNSFIINSDSVLYSVKILVNCKSGECGGKGTVELHDKKDGKLIQSFTSNDLYFSLDGNPKTISKNRRLSYKNSPLIFGDFNFDGTQDIAIRNGTNSGYHGPSYDVYLYDRSNGRMIINKGLTQLANKNLGMFDFDSKKKEITTYMKDGCCWHLTTKYKYDATHHLIKISELTEDAKNDDSVNVTKRILINGVWQKKQKKYSQKEYYKN